MGLKANGADDSNINKILDLKKEELMVDEELTKLKKEMKQRMDEIKGKEEDFRSQANNIIGNINAKDFQLIEKYNQKM